MVPRLILENLEAGRERGRFTAATLFTDLSGFTLATERLMVHGPHGAEVLAEMMREIFDPLVHSVFARGGFVTNFAGDAFTAVFPVEPGETPAAAAWRAVVTGWEIQQQMAANQQHTTPYGAFIFTIKTGIGAGEIGWGILQSEVDQRATFYFRGTAIADCADAEQQAAAGELIVSPGVTELVYDQVDLAFISQCGRVVGLRDRLPARRPIHQEPATAATVARFFPQSLIEQERSGEFRQVLYLFISLQGEPGHEALAHFAAQLFRLQAQYGGLLNRIDFGDKGCHLLLFWGAPVSQENDMTRALNFILDLRRESQIPLRAGITYRIAHAGFIGSDLHEEFTCYGRGVNLAARQMVAAGWEEVWLDNEVAQRARSQFHITNVGEQTFKGFADPQPVYALRNKRDDIPQTFYESIFLGREQEVAQLEEAIRPLWDGRYAGVLSIVGEAGMGKSRLAYEFLRSAPIAGRCQVFRCQTDEILRDSLNPFRYALRHYTGQSTAQDETANRQRFDHALDALIATTPETDLRADLERTRPFLAGLVGLRWQDVLIEQMAPELRAENTLIAIKSLLKAESLHQPVVILLEDAHWLDGDSRAFLARLTRNVEPYPLLLLVTGREAPAADWFDPAAPQQIIRLRPLDKDNVIALAESLLPAETTKTTTQLLAERADGNPYFVEQMALYLQEQRLAESQKRETAAPAQRPETLTAEALTAKALTASTPLPADISTLLTARLDRLAPEVKEVVQRAAVLGREFDPQVLTHMFPERVSVGGSLDRAAQEAIWYPVGDGNYLFKHALMREAAYGMQLHGRLRLLHREAAEAYETVLYAVPNYGQIAYHYDKGEVVIKALDYYEKAADQAKENYQNEAALGHYGRALQLTGHSDRTCRYRLFFNREEVYQWLGKRDEQQQDLDQLTELLLQDVDKQQCAELALRKAIFALVTGDYEQAQVEAQQAAELAVQAGDLAIEGRANNRLGRILWQQGHARAAEPFLEQALALARSARNYLDEAQCLYDLGNARNYQGDFADAQEFAHQAQAVYRMLNHRQGEIRCLNLTGLIFHALGDYSESHSRYESALALSREIGWRYAETTFLVNLGNNYFDLGCYDLSRDYHQQALLICREIGNKEMESVSLDTLGLIAHDQGAYALARDYYEQGLAVARAINNERSVGYILTHLGYTLLEMDDSGDSTGATAVLEQALILRRNLGNEAGAMDVLGGLARAAELVHNSGQALQYATQILDWIATNATDSLEFPVQLYLICYRILLAADNNPNNPPQQWSAQTVLATGYALLQERVARIQEETLRRQFLDNVPFNREIQAAFATVSGS